VIIKCLKSCFPPVERPEFFAHFSCVEGPDTRNRTKCEILRCRVLGEHWISGYEDEFGSTNATDESNKREVHIGSET